MAQSTKQIRIVAQTEPVSGQDFQPTAFFDADGNPVDIGGGGGDVSWGDVSGKPSTFPPASHNHTISDVTGLQGALDGKADTGDVPSSPGDIGAQPAGDYATSAALAALEARVAALEGDG